MSANTRLQMSHDIKVSLNLTGKITTLSVRCSKEVQVPPQRKKQFSFLFLVCFFFSFPNWQCTQCYTYLRKDIMPVLIKN